MPAGKSLKVVIVLHHQFDLWNAPAWFVERLRGDFPQLEIVHFSNYEGIEEQVREAEIVIAWSLRPEQIKQAKKLRWIHSPAAAVHQLMFPELIHSDLILTNAREVHGPVVAEHVIALIFALAKRLPQAARLQEQRKWGQRIMWESLPRPREVSEATVGLVGVGSIGREAAKRATAIGMQVVAVRENPGKPKPEGVETVYSVAEIEQLLSRSDYVVLAVPTTPQTRGLMNADRLCKMKADAYLINVGRGPLVNEPDLIHALQQKQIGGAALDVFEHEPLPADSPLWGLENVFITPHTASLTEKLWERHYAQISENLRRYLAHQPMLEVVDKEKGY